MITLEPLQKEDREQFIRDNQWAFKFGAQQEFGMRDNRCEEGEEVISRKTIERSIDGENAEAYRIVLDEQKVGGVEGRRSDASGDSRLGNHHSLFREAQHPLLREPLRLPYRRVLEQVPARPRRSGGDGRELE